MEHDICKAVRSIQMQGVEVQTAVTARGRMIHFVLGGWLTWPEILRLREVGELHRAGINRYLEGRMAV